MQRRSRMLTIEDRLSPPSTLTDVIRRVAVACGRKINVIDGR